jgi:hypothetical protein
MDAHALSLDESPLLLYPTLASVLAHAGLTPGVSQALWTQQLHYWLEVHRKAGHTRTHRHDGRWWTWNSIDDWQTQFPFWSTPTVKRVIGHSVKAGVTLTGNYNRAGYDRTLWYTLDYDRLQELVRAWERSRALNQTDPIDWINVIQSIGSTCTNGSDQTDPIDSIKMIQPIPEITKEYTEKERLRIWSRSCKELAMQMTRATFATWIRPLRLEQVARAPSRGDGAGEEGAYRAVLHCPTSYVQDWCQHRLDVRIREALAGALDVRAGDLDLQYVLEAGDAPA